MRRVLLFGASGFLGGHVRRALAPYATLSCPSRAEYDLIDCGVEELTALLHAVRPDAVVNCAGAMIGTGYQLVRANTAVTGKLIEAVAAGAPLARLVRLGSAAEYGRMAYGRAADEHDPATPGSEYGVSQLGATRLVQLAAGAGRVDGVVLRVFNPIGPGLPPETLLGRARALIARGGTGAGGQISLGPLAAYRDFVDVRDVAAAVTAVIETPVLPERVYNIASGRAVPVRDAVRLLAETAGFGGEIREDAAAPERSATVDWVCGDVSRAARDLRWTPGYALAESIKSVWAAAGGCRTTPSTAGDAAPVATVGPPSHGFHEHPCCSEADD